MQSNSLSPPSNTQDSTEKLTGVLFEGKYGQELMDNVKKLYSSLKSVSLEDNRAGNNDEELMNIIQKSFGDFVERQAEMGGTNSVENVGISPSDNYNNHVNIDGEDEDEDHILDDEDELEEWEDEDEEEDEDEDENDENEDNDEESRESRRDDNELSSLKNFPMGTKDDDVDEWENDDDFGYIMVDITKRDLENLKKEHSSMKRSSTNLRKNAMSWYTAFRFAQRELHDDEEYLKDIAEFEMKNEEMIDLKVENQLYMNGTFGNVVKSLSHGSEHESLEKRKKRNELDDEDDVSGGDRGDVINNEEYFSETEGSTYDKHNKNPYSRRRNNGRIIGGQAPFPSISTNGRGYSYSYFPLKVVVDPFRTGFEFSKEFDASRGTVIAGRFCVDSLLGGAAFSNAYMCRDLLVDDNDDEADPWVCLKIIKNNKDYFDQSLDEIKLLQYIVSSGDPDVHNVVKMIDYFYYKEHLIIVTELLKENLYDFGIHVRDNNLEPYFTLLRLKKIARQILDAFDFIHGLDLIHCDVKPENIVIKSYSRCEVKLIDFGSSCFTSDPLSTYIQSRSYRAPEVILGHDYDGRIDIWSLGAVLAEMFTGYVLFQNDSVASMLSRINGIFGPFPPSMLENCREASRYYLPDGITPYECDDKDNCQLIFPKKTTLAHRMHLEKFAVPMEFQTSGDNDSIEVSAPGSADETLFLDFLSMLMTLHPHQRPTARVAREHPWLAGILDVDFASLDSSYTPVGQAKIQQREQEEEERLRREMTEEDEYFDDEHQNEEDEEFEGHVLENEEEEEEGDGNDDDFDNYLDAKEYLRSDGYYYPSGEEEGDDEDEDEDEDEDDDEDDDDGDEVDGNDISGSFIGNRITVDPRTFELVMKKLSKNRELNTGYSLNDDNEEEDYDDYDNDEVEVVVEDAVKDIDEELLTLEEASSLAAALYGYRNIGSSTNSLAFQQAFPINKSPRNKKGPSSDEREQQFQEGEQEQEGGGYDINEAGLESSISEEKNTGKESNSSRLFEKNKAKVTETSQSNVDDVDD